MLRGPANRPAILLPGVVALALLIGLVLKRQWLELGFVAAVLAGSEVWRRIRPQRRAGQVRRLWPWHDD